LSWARAQTTLSTGETLACGGYLSAAHRMSSTVVPRICTILHSVRRPA